MQLSSRLFRLLLHKIIIHNVVFEIHFRSKKSIIPYHSKLVYFQLMFQKPTRECSSSWSPPQNCHSDQRCDPDRKMPKRGAPACDCTSSWRENGRAFRWKYVNRYSIINNFPKCTFDWRQNREDTLPASTAAHGRACFCARSAWWNLPDSCLRWGRCKARYLNLDKKKSHLNLTIFANFHNFYHVTGKKRQSSWSSAVSLWF